MSSSNDKDLSLAIFAIDRNREGKSSAAVFNTFSTTSSRLRIIWLMNFRKTQFLSPTVSLKTA